MSAVLLHLSGVLFHLSAVLFHLSGALFHLSGVLFHLSAVLLHLSCSTCQLPSNLRSSATLPPLVHERLERRVRAGPDRRLAPIGFTPSPPPPPPPPPPPRACIYLYPMIHHSLSVFCQLCELLLWLCCPRCRECNQHHQVMRIFNNYYVAIFNHVYYIWKHQHKTISQSGFVLQEAEKSAKKNPREFFRALEKTLSERKVRIVADDENTAAKNKPVDRVDRFAGVCDLKVDEEEEVHLV